MNNVVVQPFRGDMMDYRGGPVLEDSIESRKLRHTRYWAPADCFTDGVTAENHLDGTCTYSGPVYHHFGHVLAEMVHRILPSKKLFTTNKWLFVDLVGEPLSSFADRPTFLLDILKLMEIDIPSITVINVDTTVQHLNIVEQGSDFGAGPKPGYLDDLAEFIHPRLDRLVGWAKTWDRVYVSRSGLHHGGSFLGEQYLEFLLQKEGFHIFHPEQMPIALQMQVYRKAKSLVFCEGSACHGTELLGSGALRDVFVIFRRESHREIYGNVLQHRAHSYAGRVTAIPVGSIVTRRESKEPLDEFSVSLFDVDALVGFLREKGLARLPNFQREVYLEHAEGDLARYIQYHRDNVSPLTNPTLIPEVTQRFHEMRKTADHADFL